MLPIAYAGVGVDLADQRDGHYSDERERPKLDWIEFLFAIGGLLLTPGPTNTLLALSGASVGLRRTLPLIAAEIAGYLVVVLPLAYFGAELLARWPRVENALTLAAAAWVMFLAVRLWSPPNATAARRVVTLHRVFVTTLLNPKGLIFGLVLLPHAALPEFAPRLAVFCLLIVVVAIIWASMGASFDRKGTEGQPPPLVRRVAACWLAVLSLTLAIGSAPI